MFFWPGLFSYLCGDVPLISHLCKKIHLLCIWRESRCRERRRSLGSQEKTRAGSRQRTGMWPPFLPPHVVKPCATTSVGARWNHVLSTCWRGEYHTFTYDLLMMDELVVRSFNLTTIPWINLMLWNHADFLALLLNLESLYVLEKLLQISFKSINYLKTFLSFKFFTF